MDELTAFLNARDNEDDGTLVDATPVTNATLTTSPVTKKENHTMEKIVTRETIDLESMSREGLEEMVEDLLSKLAEETRLKDLAVANFHKKCQRIKELEGMLAGRSTPQAPVTMGGTSIPRTQVPTTKEVTSQLPVLGTPMGSADCPTCQGKVRLNKSGHCITCSNNAVKVAWQARYGKNA